MLGLVLSIAVLAIGSISQVHAAHTEADISIVLEHAKRGELATGDVAFATSGGARVDVDIDNDKEIKRIQRICNKGGTDIKVLVPGSHSVGMKTCTQGPFTVTITATLNAVHNTFSSIFTLTLI